MRVPGTNMVVERRLDASGRTTRITTDSSDHVSHQLPTKMVTVCLTFSFQDTCRETCRLPDGNTFTVSLERLRLTRTLSFIGTTRLSNVSRSATLTSARPCTLASAIRLQGVKECELP